jgi:hypothetical protein
MAARASTNDGLEKIAEPTAYFRIFLSLDDLPSSRRTDKEKINMPDMNLTNNPHTDRSPIERSHGAAVVRGLDNVPRSTLYEGRFGRMFRNLTPFAFDDPQNDPSALAETMTVDDDEDPAGNNSNIPAGFTYLGQFIDHDITFDPNSKLQRENDPAALRNFRTPRYDLDSVYADGPSDNPFIYEADGIHLLIDRSNPDEPDLPRNLNGRALLGDPRNDENLIISQLHLAMLNFHNNVVDDPSLNDFSGERRFDEARRIVRWHYQWIVIHDFLKRITGTPIIDIVDSILKPDPYTVIVGNTAREINGLLKANLKFYKWKTQPYIPVEFSVAAYRFGHSMVRGDYSLNEATADEDDQLPIFSPTPDTEEDLHGFRPRPAERLIQWGRFFEISGTGLAPQPSRKIDTLLAQGLRTLPENVAGDIIRSLAERNLRRGVALGLPSGQSVARAMGMPEDLILGVGDMGLGGDLEKYGDNTPLWYYILKEAEVKCRGNRLGPVGGRIVAEVLIGLLVGDPTSFLNVDPTWKPRAGKFGATTDGLYRMAELLKFAGAVAP